jgi:hypothetical protein
MKKCLLLLGFLVLAFVALPAAAKETVKQCLSNCRPGVNDCTKCCSDQFQVLAGPCRTACVETERACASAAIKAKCQPAKDECDRRAREGRDRTADLQRCENTYRTCVSEATAPCHRAYDACYSSAACNPEIAGGCPGEVPPQKCPFTCQTWNSASKTCIGPQTNRCPPKQSPSAKSKAPAKPPAK